jgi:hypothetical protein
VNATKAPSQATIAGSGLVAVTVFVAGLLVASATSSYNVWATVLLVPLLIAAALPVLRRQATREADPRLFWLLLFALLLKLAGALLRHYVAFDIYGGKADAGGYHKWALEHFAQFRSGDFSAGPAPLTSTHFIEFLTALLYAVIGPTILGGFLVFSWIGFWGLFFFYRAFTLAVPNGRSRTYARLLFFLPSLLFWPSSIGKEAWMIFSLGIAALGAAHVLSGRTLKGLAMSVLGLWLAAFCRPHIAGLMAIALAASYLLRRSRREFGLLAPLAKGVALAGVAVIALLFVSKAQTFLDERGIHAEQGVATALTQTSSQTDEGHSGFAPSVLSSPQRAPSALVTVLFRPFVSEAHNAQAAATGIEGTFLLLYSIFRIRSLIEAVRSTRRHPYVAFALLNTALLILALSSLANFGILARQRTQLLPVYLVLLAIRPRARSNQPDKTRADE